MQFHIRAKLQALHFSFGKKEEELRHAKVEISTSRAEKAEAQKVAECLEV